MTIKDLVNTISGGQIIKILCTGEEVIEESALFLSAAIDEGNMEGNYVIEYMHFGADGKLYCYLG